jgi:hypothetical protein
MSPLHNIRNNKKNVIWIVILFVLAVYAIISRIWIAEDAYISFRYIVNLFSGNGLVFNKLERVEGFTHPYWLLLITLIHSLGIHFHQGSILVGLILSLSGLGILTYLKIKTKSYLWIFPAVLISHEGFRDFATSGLEFSLTFFLVSLLLFTTFQKKLDSPFLLGTIISLLYHTRPEMGLLIPFYGLWKIYEDRKFPDFRWVFRFGLAIFIFAIGYHIFRFIYFQDIFTNTFYAKSGSKSRYYDGLKYLFHFVYYSKFALFVFIGFISYTIFIFLKKKIVLSFKDFPFREIILALFVAHYIVRVGGDFMGFRLLLPYFIILLFCLDYVINQYLSDKIHEKWYYKINIGLILIAFFLILEKSNYPLVKFGVVNERKVYTKGLYSDIKEIFHSIKHEWYLKGLIFKNLQQCVNVEPFIITNSVTEAKCNEKGFGLGYFAVGAGTNVSVIDELGLTDKEIAKSGKKSTMERVGHERSISIEQVIQKKAIFCSMEDDRYDRIMKTKFGILLRIDEKFLATLGIEEYENKVKGLKSLYNDLQKSSTEADKKLFSRIQMLEINFQQKIVDLPETYSLDPSLHNKEFCWQNN